MSPRYYRLNDRIRARTIRLIDEDETQVGIVAIEKALEMARSKELDLVEIAPSVNPPVCKLMDFGKFLYHQKKVERKKKKTQHQGEIKGIRLSLRIDSHDMQTKVNHAMEFLKRRNSIKVMMILRGREFSHIDIAKEKMKKFIELLGENVRIDQEPKLTGSNLIMLLAPK